MILLGKASIPDASMLAENRASVVLGSMSAGGLRRVFSKASGAQLIEDRELFSAISVTSPASIEVPERFECIHRGSKRHTCCGSPELWICKKLGGDCASRMSDKSRLQSLVQTTEVDSLLVCETCSDREGSSASRELADWPPRSGSHDVRVGFISAAYMEIGGTETFHRSLLPRLNQRIHVAGFVSTAFHGGDGKKLGVPYATGIAAAKKLAAHCDVIVAWGVQDLVKLMPTNRPRIIAVHHADWASGWNNELILTQLDTIDEVVCVNADTAQKLSVSGKPVHWIPNAIDPDRVIATGKRSVLRHSLQISSEAKIVLFGHRLSAEKRPRMAVQIADCLPPEWVMVIVGDGAERSAIEEMVATRGNVRVVGAVESLADLLSISSCFLSLAMFEGFGLSIGEAMAAGVPVVSTPTGIASEFATTLPGESCAEEWAEAIVSASVRVAPEVITERFSVDRMVAAWHDLIVK